MKDNGLISEELLEWSNELRVLRNLGAHATSEKITGQDANEAIDFLQAILETLYHLRPKLAGGDLFPALLMKEGIKPSLATHRRRSV